MVCHHLVVDGVSLRLLIEDFETAYRQARAGRTIELPEATAPAGAWAGALLEATRAGHFDPEIDHWERLSLRNVAPLPLDRTEEIPLEGTTRTTTIELEEGPLFQKR